MCIIIYQTQRCSALCANQVFREIDLAKRVDSYLKKLMKMADDLLGEEFFSNAGTSDSNNLRGMLRTKKLKLNEEDQYGHNSEKNRKVRALIDHMFHVLSVLELNAVIGWVAAAKTLRNFFEEIEDDRCTPAQRLRRDVLRGVYLELYNSLVREVPDQEFSEASASEKCMSLLKILRGFMKDHDETARAIVFVDMRRTAKKLQQFLAAMAVDIKKGLNPQVHFPGGG